jgi:glycosyltransferase involved in cell wall biosynthesis
VRVLLDYRAALRARSGVGEYTHQLVRALLAHPDGRSADRLRLSIFSSSARDRLADDPDLRGAERMDRRIPVRLLNLMWHRVGWPSVETVTGRTFDVAHSMHPLLMPAADAAQVITVHDLDFLAHPERTRAEIRRDYPALAEAHARRADQVIVVSRFTADQVVTRLGVADERISICSPGRPDWQPRQAEPADGYVLFFGTLEPRKNVGALLDAYEALIATAQHVPPLVLAGRATGESQPWLDRIARAPLAGRVRHVGYVRDEDRYRLYAEALALVQPSYEEGFGLPVLEAMTVGVPVIAANTGALPEVGGDAVMLMPPGDSVALAAALTTLIGNDAMRHACVARGLRQAERYSWTRTAETTLEAYKKAIAHRAAARNRH